MRHYLDSVVSLIQERSAEELIVGVFLALVLAMAGAGVHALARRKVKDTVTLLTVADAEAPGGVPPLPDAEALFVRLDR